jgi:hypothetical protein
MKKIFKKIKLSFLSLIVVLPVAGSIAQTRYLDEVFSSVTVTPDVLYGQNITVLSGSAVNSDLRMDVYEPANDTSLSRPLIIYMHAGTLLPIIYNQGCVGTKTDSSVVEMCTRLAKKGYVAVSMDYRLGWAATAIGVNPDLVTGTIFQAAYRAIQDAKACVRYFRANPATYKVDTNKIALGGVGVGGVIVMNYIGLRDTMQLWMPKLISGATIPSLPPVGIGMPYVDYHALGDFEGYGGNPVYNNPNNNTGHSSDVQMIFSIYGNLGDSTWLFPSMPPVVAFHPLTPPVGAGPYHWGTIAAGGFPVLSDVSGPHQFIHKLDSIGVNNVFINPGFPVLNDAFSLRANMVNDGNEALFPFATNGIEEDMWDWYDSTAMCGTAQAIGLTCQDGLNAYYGSVANNPHMSKTQAMAYIDTIQGYLAPRLFRALNLPTVGIEELNVRENDFVAYPNPATDHCTIKNISSDVLIRRITLSTLLGQSIRSIDKINKQSIDIDTKSIPAGIYTLRIVCDKGEVIKKITLQ